MSGTALVQLDSPLAQSLLEQMEWLWQGLRDHYKAHLAVPIAVPDLARACGLGFGAAQHTLRYMLDVSWYVACSGGGDQPIESITVAETVLTCLHFSQLIDKLESGAVMTAASEPELPWAVGYTDLEGQNLQASLAPHWEQALPDWLPKLPTEAQTLMREVHAAMAADLHALSAMGMRAVVDVVCHDKLGGDVGGFAAKMKALREAGYLNQVQHAALLAVVDAGHAAAHRGYVPAPADVKAMLGALDHLLQSLYVLKDVASDLGRVTPKRHAVGRLTVPASINGASVPE